MNQNDKDEHGDISLNQLMDQSNGTATSKGWWDLPVVVAAHIERNFGEILALWHSEISEVLEEWRDGHALDEIYFGPTGKPEGIPVEIADLMIRIADVCKHYGIPIVRAIQVKAIYNESRPYRHGGKRA